MKTMYWCGEYYVPVDDYRKLEQQRDELLEELKSRCLHTHYCKLGRVAYVKYSDQSSCTCGLTEAIAKAQGVV